MGPNGGRKDNFEIYIKRKGDILWLFAYGEDENDIKMMLQMFKPKRTGES